MKKVYIYPSTLRARSNRKCGTLKSFSARSV